MKFFGRIWQKGSDPAGSATLVTNFPIFLVFFLCRNVLCRNVVVPRCRGCAEREPLAGVALAVLPPGRSDGAALPELGALNQPPP